MDIKKEMTKTLMAIAGVSGLLIGEPLEEDNPYWEDPDKKKKESEK